MNRIFPQRFGSWLWLAPVLLALLAHLNVLNNGFGWDDETIIPNLVGPEHWWNLFLPDTTLALSNKENSPYFRPLVSVSYLLDHRIWGNNPFGFHLSVLSAHLLNTALVFFLARRLMSFTVHDSQPRGVLRFLPLLASSLFAVHPVHAEAVAWIAGRSDVFCTTFMLAAMIFYLHFYRTGSYTAYGLSMLTFFLALLTKEIAVALIFLFPLYEYLASTRSAHPGWRPIGLRLLIPLAIAGFYFWMRTVNITAPYGGSSTEDVSSALFLWSAFTKMIGATGFYLKLLLLPYPQNPFIDTLPTSALFIGSASLLLVLLCGVEFFALRYHQVLLGIGLAWTVLFLLPAGMVAVLNLASTPAAERYVYASSVGFILVGAWLILKGLERLPSSGIWTHHWTCMTVGLLWITAMTVGGLESWKRNAVWKSPVAFWEAAALTQAGYPHGQLGIQYSRLGRYTDAEKEFLFAIGKINNATEQAAVLSNLGNLYSVEGRFQDAAGVLKIALNQDPTNDEIYWHLAELYFAMAVRREETLPDGKRVTDYDTALFNEGEQYLKQALQMRHLLQLYYEAGTIYMTFGKQAEAASYFEKVLNAGPDSKTNLALMAKQRLDILKMGVPK